MHRKVPAWFGPGAARKGPVPARHLAGGLPVWKYRRDLERALKTLPEHAAVRELLNEKLAGVVAEQESRAAIAATPHR